MKKLILVSVSLLCLVSGTTFGQIGYYNDAILFGRTSFGGSARIQSIGGAQVSLGGDISSAQSNPAGLGFYNRSEFTFTPGLKFQTAKSSLNGGSRVESFDTNFDIGNLGIVFNNGGSNGAIKGVSFGISLNKINDFNDEIRYSDYNDFNSILFSFADNAGNIEENSLRGLEQAAYQTYLINPFIENDQVLFYDPINFIGIDGNSGAEIYSYPRQTETISTSGSQYQWNFAGGANYNDILYFGASLGYVSLNYERIRTYTENEFVILPDNVDDDILESVTLRDELDINGNGINGTFGLIFRPVKIMTFGISYETPTYYTMNEESIFSLTGTYARNFQIGGEDVTAGDKVFEAEPTGSNYKLRTPGKLNAGTTFFFGKSGFISGDIEFVDYSSSRIRSTDFSETADNDAIATVYKSTINYRVGGEYRLDVLRFRAGYSMLSNPYDSDLKRSIESYSFGMGFRQKKYYVDLGVVNSKRKSFYSPYQLADNSEPVVSTNLRDTKVMFTLGFNF